MNFLLFLIIWYCLGLAGCFIGCYSDYLDGDDFTVESCVQVTGVSILGPIVILIALTNCKNISDITIIKGKGKK